MAKISSSYKSLCISEVCPNTPRSFRWRRLAELFSTPDNRFMLSVPSSPAFLEGAPAPTELGVLRVFEWQQGNPASSKVVKNVVFCEKVSSPEFDGVFLEEEEKIQRILKNGFSIKSYSADTSYRSSTPFIIPLQSKTGGAFGLLFDETSKVSFGKPSAYDSGYTKVSISKDVGNMAITPHGISVVSIETNLSNQCVPYKLGFGPSTREFVLLPETIKRISPYSARDYAPVYFRRMLQSVSGIVSLESERKLSKNDIAKIVEVLVSGLDAEKSQEFASMMSFSNIPDAEALMCGLRNQMGEVQKMLAEDTKLSEQVKTILWSDQSIRDYFGKIAAAEWENQHGPEIEALEKRLVDLRSEVMKAAAVKKDIEKYEKKLIDLKAKCTDQKKKNDVLENHLRDVIDECREDASDLLMQVFGFNPNAVTTKGLPIVREVSVASIGIDKWAFDDTSALGKALDNKNAFVVDGLSSEAISAFIASEKKENILPVVTFIDGSCSLEELVSTINGREEKVVLVEGVYAATRDIIALSVLRMCRDKVIVFSKDEDFFDDRVSPVLKKMVYCLFGDTVSYTDTQIGCFFVPTDVVVKE